MVFNSKWCILLVMAMMLESIYSEKEYVVVNISQGTVKGRKFSSSDTKPYYSFEGIPYAKPPVGDLRFKAPVEPDAWEGTLEALEDANFCQQYNALSKEYKGVEDCLFINVYTPKLPGQEPLKPVMVFIHGGAFKIGPGVSHVSDPEYLVNTGIVYVSFKYRLGVFGFLSTEDGAAPGNAGMKDQVQALRWIQKNIAAFGGDPSKVTIFGQSAGGSSVHYHMLSPMSKGLFHRAIAMSGVAVNPWAIATSPRESAFELAEIVGISANTSEELVSALRSVDASKLVIPSENILSDRNRLRLMELVFVPSVEPIVDGEEAFLTDNSLHLLDEGKFHDIPFIVGLTSSEGIVFFQASGVHDNSTAQEIIDNNFNEYLKSSLRICQNDPCGDNMVSKIRSFYFGDEHFNNDTFENFVKLTTDITIAEGIVHAANKISSRNTSPVYLYKFSYEGGFGFSKKLFRENFLSGVAHGDDLGYLFHSLLLPEGSENDKKVRNNMVNMWTNFAKAGNPTPEPENGIATWLPYTIASSNYLDIDLKLALKQDLYKERMDFWRELYSSNES